MAGRHENPPPTDPASGMVLAWEVSIGEGSFPTALNLTPTLADRESNRAAKHQVVMVKEETDK
jgi:hypothetical protein